MSGLEPLAALGLACNILQLVELGRQTIALVTAVYQGRKPDEELDANAATLAGLADEVRRHGRPGARRYEEVLLESAARCAAAAGDLREEVRFLVAGARQGSLASALRVATKVAWRKRRLERLKEVLDGAERLMQTSLLARVWSATNAADIELRGVRRELRFFVEQYRQGRRETTDLVSLEGLRTREHVSHEAERTNQAVARVDQKVDRLVVLREARGDERDRGRFLQSLKYPGFNERRNQVADAYGDSLEWVFAGDNDDGPDQDSRSVESHGADEDQADEGSDSGGDSRDSAGSDADASHSEGEEHPRYQDYFSDVKWDSFSNWLSSTDSIYWISGKAGSGKTTLVKYVLSQGRTKKYLDIWSPGCKIVSHYFWRPGSRMQKNMEGLFCSLLYQLLGSSATALGRVMTSVSGPKDSHVDWSSAELRSALLRALDLYEHGVCLFLDGLDEIDPEDGTKDGIPECLDWALELSQRSNIKICLASRPEPPILKRRLLTYPRLQLQDLNHQDLMVYAEGHVRFHETYTSDKGADLIRLLVDKAEGVFLWLILATKSINEGIQNGDGASADSLRERIEDLSPELDALYQDMWRRAGANSPKSYRQTAALYLKLFIASQRSEFRLGGFLQSFGMFSLMLATTPIADEVLDVLGKDPSKLVRQDAILQEYRKVERKLDIYCVGLVDVGPENPLYEGSAADNSWYGHRYDGVFPLATSAELRFIHRTARDFLTDTEPGMEILGFDRSSDFALHYRLMKAWLAKLALFAGSGSEGDWAVKLRQFRELWEDTEEWVSEDWGRLVVACERLANSGRLFGGGYDKTYSCAGADFLKFLACQECDDHFLVSRLRDGDRSGDEKSEILLAMCKYPSLSRSRGGQARSRLHTFRELLEAGADPNWRGWTLWDRRNAGWSGVPLETPWRRYLLTVFRLVLGQTPRCHFQEVPDLSPADVAFLLEIVRLFISRGARLDDMVNMVIGWEDDRWRVRHITFDLWLNHFKAGVYASIPAYVLVRILNETLRNSSSQSGERSVSEELYRSLEREYTNRHHDSKVPLLFGKTRRDRSTGTGPLTFFESKDEVQAQLASRLVESVERQFVASMAIIESEEDRPEARDFSEEETARAILDEDDASWTAKVEGDEAIFNRSVELGLATTRDGTCERHSLINWVKKQNGIPFWE